MVGPKASVDINVLAVSRVALVLAMALMFGSVLVQSVNAEKIPANGVSIAKRVGYQKQLCEDGGGSFESTKTAFGSTITTCTGGEEDGRTCVNTVQSTDCRNGLTRPPEDPYTPPIGGVYDEPVLGGIQTGDVVGSTTGDQVARAAAGDDSDERYEKKRKGKKQESKKGKAGGKRRG